MILRSPSPHSPVYSTGNHTPHRFFVRDHWAAVQKFQRLEGAPPLIWADIDGEVPNAVLNMTDILQIVQGFKGEPYPFRDPAECP